MSKENNQELSYLQVNSSINPSFWNKFTELKLDVDRLAEVQHDIWGYFSIIFRRDCITSILEIDSTSFNKKFDGQNTYISFHGKLINKNTIEQFRECDKIDLINGEGKNLLENIKNETVLRKPSMLNCFLVLSFADLKKYHYYYWFAFPVPKGLIVDKKEFCLITEEFSDSEVNKWPSVRIINKCNIGICYPNLKSMSSKLICQLQPNSESALHTFNYDSLFL